MQILAGVNRLRVIGGVKLNGRLPVVRGPNNLDAGAARAFSKTAEAREKIDRFQSTVMDMQT